MGRIARSLHSRNPFYLLSALCMLSGCFALSRALDLGVGSSHDLLALMGVLQLYELVLLGLAVLLLHRFRRPIDARSAFLLGLLFVADLTYLNTELATSNPWSAPWVALAHLAFLVPKLVVLRDALGLTSLRTLSVTVGSIALLLYLPGAFSAAQFVDGKVHALGLGREVLPFVGYGFWWIAGALPLFYLWADRPTQHGELPLARIVSRTSLLMPFASLMVHLAALHWMYGLPIYGVHITPLFVGVSAYVAYNVPAVPFRWVRVLQWGAPGVGVVFSLAVPDALSFTWGESFVVTPFRIALLGVAAVYVVHRVMSYERAFGWGAALTLVTGLSGHSASSVRRAWERALPESAAEYGVAAMVAAFALLALALAVSLWQPPTDGRAAEAATRLTEASKG